MIPARLQVPWPDEEEVVLDMLGGFFDMDTYGATVYMGTETPTNINQRLPFIRVGRVGGAPDDVTDHPVVDIDVLALTRGEAKEIATTIQQLLLKAPHPIDSCNVLMSPQKVEWQEGSPIRRFYASYQLSLRR